MLCQMYLKKLVKNVRRSDLVVRCDVIEQLDFLQCNEKVHDTDIVTNPPYKYALDFVNHTIDLVDDGRYVCMFLKLQFLEGKERRLFYNEFPPKRVWVSSSRIECCLNGIRSHSQTAICYTWFIWQKVFKGITELHWMN